MRLIRLLKNDLVKEITDWVKKDIISEPQAEQICAQYDIDYHQSGQRMLGYNILISLGYLFVGLALITLIGANWDELPRALRMWALIALTMLTQGLAIKKYAVGEANGSIGIFLLGNVFFGAAIILIAQIYHLGEHMPDGILWWALGCLPIGLIIYSRWLMIQSLLLALTWFFVEADLGFYPSLFPLFILASLWVLYKGQQSIILFILTVFSMVVWFEFSLAELWRTTHTYRFHEEHVLVSIALCLFGYAISEWMAKQKSIIMQDYAAVLALWSLRFTLLFLLIMSFSGSWRELLEANWAHQSSMYIVITILCTASLFFVIRAKKIIPFASFLIFYGLFIVTLGISQNQDYSPWFQIADNIVLIVLGISLIIKGIHHGISHYFFLGIATIMLTALLRYINLIGDYVGGAMLFMLFAGLLIGAAKFWQRSQKLEVIDNEK